MWVICIAKLRYYTDGRFKSSIEYFAGKKNYSDFYYYQENMIRNETYDRNGNLYRIIEDVFDINGNVIARIFYDKDGSYESKSVYTLDSYGNLLYSLYYRRDKPDSECSKTEYVYEYFEDTSYDLSKIINVENYQNQVALDCIEDYTEYNPLEYEGIYTFVHFGKMLILFIQRITFSNPANSKESTSKEGDNFIKESILFSESTLESESLLIGVIALTSNSLSVQDVNRKIRRRLKKFIIINFIILIS